MTAIVKGSRHSFGTDSLVPTALSVVEGAADRWTPTALSVVEGAADFTVALLSALVGIVVLPQASMAFGALGGPFAGQLLAFCLRIHFIS